MAEGTLVITISNQLPAPPVWNGNFIAGWHVPTWLEMQDLRIELDPINISDPSDNDAGGKMKMTGIDYWQTPNTGATNSSGWNGKGTGFRGAGGPFTAAKLSAYYWNTYDAGVLAGITSLTYDTDVFMAAINIQGDKTIGCNVRLIKNDNIDPGTVTDYDGNVYPTVKIGTQVWMAEDLRTTHYANGTLIPLVTENAAWAALTTAGMCYYDNIP